MLRGGAPVQEMAMAQSNPFKASLLRWLGPYLVPAEPYREVRKINEFATNMYVCMYVYWVLYIYIYIYIYIYYLSNYYFLMYKYGTMAMILIMIMIMIMIMILTMIIDN